MNTPGMDSGKQKPPLELTPQEERKIEKATGMAVVVIHEAVRNEGEAELRRPSSALAWSALAAGLSMGFSLVVEGVLYAHVPEIPWRFLVSKLGYTVGFLIVILGRQQLFTENTLTVILPLLYHHNLPTLLNVLRLWGIVLIANLLGVWLFALGLREPLFDRHLLESFRAIGSESLAPGPEAIFLRGILGGWLIALMVWLLPGSESSRLPTIVIITYIVGICKLSHVIAGSAATFFLAENGYVPFADYFLGYLLPSLAGNIIGGVALVAALNHAQVVAGKGKKEFQ